MVDRLRDSAAAAVTSTATLVESHEFFARSVVEVLSRSIAASSSSSSSSDSTVDLLRPTEVVSIGDKILLHSQELSRHTHTMLDQLSALTEHLDSLRREKEKKNMWHKVWGWLLMAFYVLSGVLAVAAFVAPAVVPGVGVVASAVFGGGAALTSAAATLCKELKDESRREAEKYKALHGFLLDVVPEQAARAESSLVAFESCLRVQELNVLADKGKLLKMRN